MPRKGPRLNIERRQVLKLLANSRSGLTEELLAAGHLFSRRKLAGLVSTGLATAERETIKAGAKPVEIVRIRITDAGRRAIEA